MNNKLSNHTSSDASSLLINKTIVMIMTGIFSQSIEEAEVQNGRGAATINDDDDGKKESNREAFRSPSLNTVQSSTNEQKNVCWIDDVVTFKDCPCVVRVALNAFVGRTERWNLSQRFSNFVCASRFACPCFWFYFSFTIFLLHHFAECALFMMKCNCVHILINFVIYSFLFLSTISWRW